MRLKFIALLMLLALGAFVVAGCGDDNETPATEDNAGETQQQDSAGEDSSSSGSGTKLALTADPNGALSYDTDKLATKTGDVNIRLTNESTTPHDVAVEDSDGNELGKSEEVTQGATDLELNDVKAGSYTFFCSVPGHEAAGMKGTLTVR